MTSSFQIACRFGLSNYVERTVKCKTSRHGTDHLLVGIGLAARFGHENIIDTLIQYAAVLESAPGLVVQSENIDLVKKLLSIKNDVNKVDSKWHTPLHHAAARANLDMVSSLLENGADKKARRIDGLNGYHLAAIMGHLAEWKL